MFLTIFLVARGAGRVEKSYKESIDKKQRPHDIFSAIGAIIVDDYEEKDGSYHRYIVKYQGGHFAFIFHKDSPWVTLRFFGFKDCAYEHLYKAYTAANSINITQSAWSCNISLIDSPSDNTHLLTASLDYLFSSIGDLKNIAETLQVLMSEAFSLSRDFSAELDKAIKENDEKNEEFFNNFVFSNNLETMMRAMEKKHSYTTQEDKNDNAQFSLSASQLVHLYNDVNFGCLLSLKIIYGDHVERTTDISSITAFDIRQYICQHTERTSLNSIIFVYEFEQQELFVTLTKAKGSTENTLYYIVNIVRSGCELDKFMDNRNKSSCRTMLEVRLTDDDKAVWESKYMIDDTMEKVTQGKLDELSDEQRLLAAHTNPSVQADLYWGKKYFNNSCYYQALYHFNRVYRAFDNPPEEQKEDLSLFYEICYYIGFIYADFGMNDRAFYYLNIAQKSNYINHIQEFINCICNMKDPFALGTVTKYMEKIQEDMNTDEAEAERLMPFYQFFQRRYAYMLIEYRQLDKAEEFLNIMIERNMDVEFAKGELEYIHKIRNEETNNQ
jgi:hypothetical protein